MQRETGQSILADSRFIMQINREHPGQKLHFYRSWRERETKAVSVFIFSAAFLTVLTSPQNSHCSCWNLTFIRRHFSWGYQRDWCRPARLPFAVTHSPGVSPTCGRSAFWLWPCSECTSHNSLTCSEGRKFHSYKQNSLFAQMTWSR